LENQSRFLALNAVLGLPVVEEHSQIKSGNSNGLIFSIVVGHQFEMDWLSLILSLLLHGGDQRKLLVETSRLVQTIYFEFLLSVEGAQPLD